MKRVMGMGISKMERIAIILLVIGVACGFWLGVAALSLMQIANRLKEIQKQIRK